MVEIIVCFNTSYYDEETNQFETSRWKIAKTYIKGWFWVDLVAWIPRIFKMLEALESITIASFLSFFKVARITRLIKLFRLVKLVKRKASSRKFLQKKMRLNVAKERFLIFSIFALLFVHTIACIWIFLGSLNQEEDDSDNWIDKFGFDIHDIGSMYTTGVYWTITTIATVGYGDITATNTSERIVACVIMIIGVLAFSFSTGSLSSIIHNVDSKQAAYR